jgi:hypothetical protein
MHDPDTGVSAAMHLFKYGISASGFRPQLRSMNLTIEAWSFGTSVPFYRKRL